VGVIVEMLGAPGAGKTTMVAAVEEGCRAAGRTPFTIEHAARCFADRTVLGRLAIPLLPHRFERRAQWAVYRLASGWHTLRFAVVHHGLTRYLLASQRGRPSAADAKRRRVVYWYLRMMGSYGFLRSKAAPDEVVVIDEGFVHRAVQVHASAVESPTASQIARYVAVLPRPALVVHVDASSATCWRRVQARGAWDRLSHRSPAEIERFVEHAHETVALLRAELDRQGWRVLEVDNDNEDPGGAATVVTRALTPLLAGSDCSSEGPSR
jgi:thymidylate kinase